MGRVQIRRRIISISNDHGVLSLESALRQAPIDRTTGPRDYRPRLLVDMTGWSALGRDKQRIDLFHGC